MQFALYRYGLFLSRDAAPGEVVLNVPLSACLVVDYEAGLQVCPSVWFITASGCGRRHLDSS